MGNPLARLLEVAAPQHGLITVAQAASLANVGREHTRRLAAAGILERRHHGIYRVAALPCSTRTLLMEAVLWSQGRGRIGGEGALVLWSLLEEMVGRIRVEVPAGYRPRRVSGARYLVRPRPENGIEEDPSMRANIAVVDPAPALLSAIDDGVDGTRVAVALDIARLRGLVSPLEAARVRLRLAEASGTPRGDPPPSPMPGISPRRGPARSPG
jgi:predicted transcriptional regulator of viral defense system